MKKILFLFALLLVSLYSFAIDTAVTGHARITIVDGITVVETQQLNFGSIDASAVAGTVVVNYDGIRSSIGGVTEIGTGFNSGSFTITGTPGTVVNYVVQTTPITLLGASTGQPLIVDNFTVSNASGTTNTGGTAILKVGATANIMANQAVDVYTGTYNVTVSHE